MEEFENEKGTIEGEWRDGGFRFRYKRSVYWLKARHEDDLIPPWRTDEIVRYIRLHRPMSEGESYITCRDGNVELTFYVDKNGHYHFLKESRLPEPESDHNLDALVYAACSAPMTHEELLDESNRRLASGCVKLREELAEIRKAKQDLEKELDGYKAEARQLCAAFTAGNKGIDRVRKERDVAREQLADAVAQVALLETGLRYDIRQLDIEKNNLVKELSRLNSKNIDLDGKLKSKDHEIRVLKEENDLLNEAVADNWKSVEARNAEITRLANEVSRLNSEVDLFDSRFAEVSKEKTMLQRRNRKLLDEIEGLHLLLSKRTKEDRRGPASRLTDAVFKDPPSCCTNPDDDGQGELPDLE